MKKYARCTLRCFLSHREGGVNSFMNYSLQGSFQFLVLLLAKFIWTYYVTSFKNDIF